MIFNPGNKHGHTPDYWLAGKPGDAEKKDRVRLVILLSAIGVALIIFIICILLAVGKAQVSGYIPTLILELDLTPIGKKPIVLGTLKLPEIQKPFPGNLEFPEQTFEKDLEFDTSFSPKINRKVEYVPVYRY